MFKHINLILVLVLFPIMSFSSLKGNDSPQILTFIVIQDQFPFSRATVQSATMEMKNGIYQGLHVKLKPSVAQDFERITRLGQGKFASFILNGKVISSAVIATPMGGDLLLMIPKAEAEIFLRQIADNPLSTIAPQPSQPPQATSLLLPPPPQSSQNSAIIEE